jgi:two-component system chemotaxis response regulator CheY
MADRNGYQINTTHEAGDGQEALELLRSQRVNLVLTDINMLRMDGLELLPAIRRSSEWAAVHVVMIRTEGGAAESRKRCAWGPQGTSGSPSRQIKIKEKLVGLSEPAVSL